MHTNKIVNICQENTCKFDPVMILDTLLTHEMASKSPTISPFYVCTKGVLIEGRVYKTHIVSECLFLFYFFILYLYYANSEHMMADSYGWTMWTMDEKLMTSYKMPKS